MDHQVIFFSEFSVAKLLLGLAEIGTESFCMTVRWKALKQHSDDGSVVLSRFLVAVPVEEKLLLRVCVGGGGCEVVCFELALGYLDDYSICSDCEGAYKLQVRIEWTAILSRTDKGVLRHVRVSIRAIVVSCQEQASLCFICCTLLGFVLWLVFVMCWQFALLLRPHLDVKKFEIWLLQYFRLYSAINVQSWTNLA
jgi:hypothetical protein